MKIILTEKQEENLFANFLNDLLQGHELKFENEDRVVYLDDKPIVKLLPSKAIIDVSILDEIKKVFFYESPKDFKNSFREWVSKTFGIKGDGGHFYGITFKNLSKLK